MLTKQIFLSRLLFFIILCNPIFNIVTNVTANAAPPINGWLSSETNLDRNEIPKNILLGANTGGWSHLRLILTIGNILADRGYNVTLAARGTFPQSSQYPKIHFISIGDENRDFSKDPEFQKMVYEKFDVTKFNVVFKSRLERYNETFLKLKQVSEALKPDLFFCDTLNNEPCADVAWLMKKPLVGIATSILGMTRVPYRSDPIFGCKINMENESFWQRFKCEIFPGIRLFSILKPIADKLNEIRASYGLPPSLDIFERWKGSLFLFDTFFGYEVPVPLPPLYQEIGPVLPDYYPPLTPELEEFITSHKRTIFVGLGTFLFLSPENNAKLLQSFIEASEKNIIDGVIWANIKKNQHLFPQNITLSDGRIISTSDVFNNKHPNIHIASYAPQFAILNHTNTKLFLSHAGSGSIYESVYTGTPVLALPLVFDQIGNAAKLVSTGVALELDKLDLQVNDIIEKMEFLQKDEKIQINLKRLKSLAIINSKRKYRAADLIEYTLLSSKLKHKDDDESEVEDWTFKGLITPDTRMGFIKGKYLDVYAVALTIFIGILFGVLSIVNMIGKLVFRKLFKNRENKEKNE